VVTWPQSRVVSRQTVIGLTELAAQDGDGYVRIAVELAADSGRLQALRDGLRQRMPTLPLCDVGAFTRALEDALLALAHQFAAVPD
jgi:predicted O-linked N-acetylglucosamine transferase (SPINDLY family)